MSAGTVVRSVKGHNKAPPHPHQAVTPSSSPHVSQPQSRPSSSCSNSRRSGPAAVPGVRVAALAADGKYRPAVVASIDDDLVSVRFEDDAKNVVRISAQDLIGPGFGSVTGIQLTPGQMVFVTHCNREMQGAVLRHKANLDQVVIQLLNGGPEVKKKLDEVRLVESRKSARLVNQSHNKDFSKLADLNIVSERKRLIQLTQQEQQQQNESSATGSGHQSRKRRGSETLSSDDSSVSDEAEPSSFEQIRGHHHHARHSRSSHGGLHHHSSRRKLNFEQAKSSKQKGAQPQPGSSGVMTECTAALVLMNLSLPNGSASTTTTSVSDVEDGRETPINLIIAEDVDPEVAEANNKRAVEIPTANSSFNATNNSSRISSNNSTPTNEIISMAKSASSSQPRPICPPPSTAGVTQPKQAKPGQGGSVSPSSSSGVGSLILGSSWSSSSSSSSSSPGSTRQQEAQEALLQLSTSQQQRPLSNGGQRPRVNGQSESDEGIVSDHSSISTNDVDERLLQSDGDFSTVYVCRWRGCQSRKVTESAIVRHVRRKHLRKTEVVDGQDEDDGEEEFYYEEIEIPKQKLLQQQQQILNLQKSQIESVKKAEQQGNENKSTNVLPTIPPSSATAAPPMVLADHMDMARPAHEDPTLLLRQQKQLLSAQSTQLTAVTAQPQQQTATILTPRQYMPTIHVSVAPSQQQQQHLANPQQQQLIPQQQPPVQTTTLVQVQRQQQVLQPPTTTVIPAPQPQLQPQQQQFHPHFAAVAQQQRARSNAVPIAIPVSSLATFMSQQQQQQLQNIQAVATATPANNSGVSATKYIRLNPKPISHQQPQTVGQPQQIIGDHNAQRAAVSQVRPAAVQPHHPQQHQVVTAAGFSGGHVLPKPPAATLSATPPLRKPRGEAKKCRKVYGMDHKEQWCTQCKWKKACTRFQGDGV